MKPITGKEMYTLGQMARCVWQDGEVPLKYFEPFADLPDKRNRHGA